MPKCRSKRDFRVAVGGDDRRRLQLPLTAMPRHGWWVFAALNEDDKKLTGPDGQAYPVEIGALIWVHAVDIE